MLISAPRDDTERIARPPVGPRSEMAHHFGDITLGLWRCMETKPLATFRALTSSFLDILICATASEI